MKRASSLRLSRPKPIGRSWSEITAMRSRLLLRRRLVLRRPAGGRDDVLVARAAADAAGDRGADLLLGGVRVGVQQRPRGHDHPGGAEAALERMLLVEALLDRVEHAIDLERLDRADLVALAHRGEDRAGFHG